MPSYIHRVYSYNVILYSWLCICITSLSVMETIHTSFMWYTVSTYSCAKYFVDCYTCYCVLLLEKAILISFSWMSIMLLRAVQQNNSIMNILGPFISVLIIKVLNTIRDHNLVWIMQVSLFSSALINRFYLWLYLYSKMIASVGTMIDLGLQPYLKWLVWGISGVPYK